MQGAPFAPDLSKPLFMRYGSPIMRRTYGGIGVLCVALLAPLLLASPSSAALAQEALYVANASGPSVYEYALGEDGSLLRASSVPKTEERPDRLAVSPDHKSLYVAEGNTVGIGALLQYTIEPDGTLAPKEPVKVLTEKEIEGIAISPDGSSLYVIEGGFTGRGQVARYAIGSGGTLSATDSTKVATGEQPFDIAVRPDGKSVYVSNWLEGTISQYSVQIDGSLTPMSSETVPTGPQPYRLAISPDGHSLYVTDEHFIVEPSESYEGWVSQFTIAPDGSLTPKTPATVPTGPEPKGIVISPDGANLYVADSTEDGVISQFAIGSDGTLQALTSPTVGAGRQPFEMAISLDGKHLYATNSAEYTIGQYEIGAGGALEAMKPATVSAGAWPMSIVLVQTEREPTIAPEEPEKPQEKESPIERCYEPPPWRCREPEPPSYCRVPETPPDRCCGQEPGGVEPLTPTYRCCRAAPGEAEPLVIIAGCEREEGHGPGEVTPYEEPAGTTEVGQVTGSGFTPADQGQSGSSSSAGQQPQTTSTTSVSSGQRPSSSTLIHHASTIHLKPNRHQHKKQHKAHKSATIRGHTRPK